LSNNSLSAVICGGSGFYFPLTKASYYKSLSIYKKRGDEIRIIKEFKRLAIKQAFIVINKNYSDFY
jgi:hypothetical protein